MARPKTFTDAEISSLLKAMRADGVSKFKYKGLEVEFMPGGLRPFTAEMDENDDPFIAKERLKEAMENFKATNKTAEEDLLWST